MSLEVSPELAASTEKTIGEARRLWREVDKPNLMIKVPATPEGIPAIETLISEGVNVNATLIFSVQQYDDVARAYLRGLAKNPEPTRVASVASYFVSRIDTAVDKALEAGTREALMLRGTAAVACCKLVYHRFQEIFTVHPFTRKASAEGKFRNWSGEAPAPKTLSIRMCYMLKR